MEDADFVAHRADARALGDATQALGDATGTAALDQWNDADGRNLAEVVGGSGSRRSPSSTARF